MVERAARALAWLALGPQFSDYVLPSIIDKRWREWEREARAALTAAPAALSPAVTDEVPVDTRRSYHAAIDALLKMVAQDRLSDVERQEFDRISEDHSWDGLSCACGGGWLIGHASGCPEAALSEAEPVAWMATFADMDGRTLLSEVYDSAGTPLRLEGGRTVGAILRDERATPARTTAVGAEVKPLEWQESPGLTNWAAQTSIGVWQIIATGGKFFARLDGHAINEGRGFLTLISAKDFIEAEHQTRIRSALVDGASK